MASEAITRNDLKNILDEVLPTEPEEPTGFGPEVELSYNNTSYATAYTAPANGIVIGNCNYRPGQYVQIFIDNIIVTEGTGNSSGNHSGNMVVCAPVLKGQKIHCAVNTTAYSKVSYRPYV